MAVACAGCFAACGAATGVGIDDDGSPATGGTGGTTSSGGTRAAGGKSTGAVSKGTGGTHAKDFDRSCSFPSDCMLVSEEDPCSCHAGCFDAAINYAEADRWRAAAQCGQAFCPDSTPCSDRASTCENHRCVTVPVPTIQLDDFPRDCVRDEDCLAIQTGPFCGACHCEGGAVNKAGYVAYVRQTGDLHCPPIGGVCDCHAPDKAYCNSGRCEAKY
jgi:hypothetical protein